MLKIRSLIVASTGAVVALGYVAPAIAQVSAPLNINTINATDSTLITELPSTLLPFPEAETSTTDAIADSNAATEVWPAAFPSEAPPAEVQPFPEVTEIPSEPEPVELDLSPEVVEKPLTEETDVVSDVIEVVDERVTESLPDRDSVPPTPQLTPLTPIEATTAMAAENAIKAVKTTLSPVESTTSTTVAEPEAVEPSAFEPDEIEPETVAVEPIEAETVTLPDVVESESVEPIAAESEPSSEPPAIAEVETNTIRATEPTEQEEVRSPETLSDDIASGEVAHTEVDGGETVVTKPAKTPALPTVATAIATPETPTLATPTPDEEAIASDASEPSPAITQTFQVLESDDTPSPLTEQTAKRTKPTTATTVTTATTTAIAPPTLPDEVNEFEPVATDDSETDDSETVLDALETPEADPPDLETQTLAVEVEVETEMPVVVPNELDAIAEAVEDPVVEDSVTVVVAPEEETVTAVVETPEEVVIPEEVVTPEETALAPEDIVPEDIVPEDIVPEDIPTPANTVPENTAPTDGPLTDFATNAEPEPFVLPYPGVTVANESEAGLEDTSNELIIPGEIRVEPSEAEPITIEPFTPNSGNQAEDLRRFKPGQKQVVPPPDFLNPSGNPLLFPTEPNEVAIDINQPVTLEQALALARRNNQDLQSARLTLDRAYETLNEAKAGRLPSVDATASLSRTNSASTEISQRRAGALNSALGSDATTDTFNAEVRVSYDIFNGGQRGAQIRAAEHSVRSSQLEIEELTEDIHLATAQAYYALQQADSQVGIEVAAVEQASQTLRDARLLKEAGLGTRFDEIRANVELANSQQSLTQARAAQSIARRELGTVLSLGQQVEITTADQISPVESWNLSLEETIVLAYRNRAELEQRLIDREIQEEERRIARAATRPQVSAFATYDVLEILDDNFNGSSGYSIGVQAQMNLFDGGASRARKRQEEIDLELAEVAFEQERNQIRLEVEDAYYNFEANELNITTADQAVSLAKESLRLARLRFGAGVGTQTDVIDAQTELTRARGNLLSAIVTYNNSIASLQRAVSNDPDRRLFDLP